MTILRLAHLSDLHFGHVTFSFTQFLSKRWIGNLNLLLFRKKSFKTDHLSLLHNLLRALKVDDVLITGDFTSTALAKEFIEAKEFVKEFAAPVFTIPGNHDCYTKKAAQEKLYYQYFPSPQGSYNRVLVKKLKGNWWWVGLDCAVPTPPFNSYGVFSLEIENALSQALQTIPAQDNVILGNHFPLFSSKGPRHDLKGRERLVSLLKSFPCVKLYLHGHNHTPYIIDRQEEGLPIVINCGSSSHVPNGGFYLITIQEALCQIHHYFYDQHKGWYPEKEYTFLIT